MKYIKNYVLSGGIILNNSTGTQVSIKTKVQTFGRFLSSMVMPNIGAFIAWGIITTLFTEYGWYPNSTIAVASVPMLRILLPMLVGYTGGQLIGGNRGGVVGVCATFGVMLGAGGQLNLNEGTPMFLGAMIAGPFGGYVIKYIDNKLHKKIPEGFDLLVFNFTAGIAGALMTCLGIVFLGPIIESITFILGKAVRLCVEADFLPFASMIIEPAKVLFLNNAINHGVITPLGAEETALAGKSLYYLLEANPGPGLGLLLACWIFGKGIMKNSAPGALIIHFFGGIHELYFPYVLMKPVLILGLICGGMTGILTNVMLKGGLVAPAAPGSIFTLLAMSPKGGVMITLFSVITSATVSFILSSILITVPIFDADYQEDLSSDIDESFKTKENIISSEEKSEVTVSKPLTIAVACDAGMGLSEMGANRLRKKVREAGLDIVVINSSISELTEGIDIVITHKSLAVRAKSMVKKPTHISISNFLDEEFYSELVERLKRN